MDSLQNSYIRIPAQDKSPMYRLDMSSKKHYYPCVIGDDALRETPTTALYSIYS